MSRQKSPVPRPQYYTTNEVAVTFGVSNQTVVNWVNSGRLSAHKTLGGHRRISIDALLTFARTNRYPLPPHLAYGGEAPRKKKILVVDDQVDFSDMVSEYLTAREDLEVWAANSGFAAGREVERFKPDLILMDLMMPDLDGFEVNRMLRNDPRTSHIPVIACTAFYDPNVARRISEEQFDGFIEKPLKLDQLLDLIRNRLQLAQ